MVDCSWIKYLQKELSSMSVI